MPFDAHVQTDDGRHSATVLDFVACEGRIYAIVQFGTGQPLTNVDFTRVTPKPPAYLRDRDFGTPPRHITDARAQVARQHPL